MTIPRHLLEKLAQGDPRLLAELENQSVEVSETSKALNANVETTGAIKDAAVVLLSGNSEFTNERVLRFSEDVDLEIGDTEIRLKVRDCVRASGFTVRLIPSADTEVSIPPSGTLLSTLGNALANYADDAGAASGGIPVGGLYRNGSAVMIRVT